MDDVAITASWTDERVQILKQEWESGLPFSQIAALLGGVTRSAVIGKASRLGLTHRPRTASVRASSVHRTRPDLVKRKLLEKMTEKPVPATRAGRMQRQREIATIRAEGFEDISAPVTFDPACRVTFFELRKRHCRFPLWSDSAPAAEQFFCGAPSADMHQGISYCAGHRAIVHRPRSVESA